MGVSPDRFFRGNFEITYKMGLQKKNRFLGGNFEITYSKRVLGLGLGLTWGWGWGWGYKGPYKLLCQNKTPLKFGAL